MFGGGDGGLVLPKYTSGSSISTGSTSSGSPTETIADGGLVQTTRRAPTYHWTQSNSRSLFRSRRAVRPTA
jgi:hypothetical protein